MNVPPIIGALNFEGAKIIAQHIVQQIGRDTLYTTVNEHHPDAPENWLLRDVNVAAQALKDLIANTPHFKTPIDNIYLIDDPLADDNVYGLYVRIGGNCFIVTRPEQEGYLNKCWKRFAIMKELCSLYIDYLENNHLPEGVPRACHNYLDSINNAFALKSRFLTDTHFSMIGDGDMDREYFSSVLATELLIPPTAERSITRELLDKSHDLLGIARSLMIPQQVLALYAQSPMR